MKKLMLIALTAASAAVLFTGCQKEETTGRKVDKAVEAAKDTAKTAAKTAEKSAADLQKKLDEAAKK